MKLDKNLIGFINLFEGLTKANVKDIFVGKDNELIFVVNEGDIGKAIGKMGRNIKRLSGLMKKRIKVIEYSNNVIDFLKSAIDPIKADSFEENDENVKVILKDTSMKARLIGRDKRNINELNEIVGKYFKKKIIT